jgi:hypothetical protein
MSDDFNNLELAILEWLKLTYENSELALQVASAQFVKREWTGVGFYTYIKISNELNPINLENFDGKWPIDGPYLKSADIENGGGTIIWGENGYVNCIEMYAYGSYFNEQVNVFELAP